MRLSYKLNQINQINQINRMKELTQQLTEASKSYYQENFEIISDFEYDRLYEELEALEASTGVQLAGSPTVQVGYEAVEGLEKSVHKVSLLSLDKTKDMDKLADFLGEHQGLLSWKLDGLTIVLTYEGGILTKAVTRGNGIVGEDVTHNARTFENIPLRIPYTGQLLIRGEAVITYQEFEAINASIEDPDDRYKNPRNLCSGVVRQLDRQSNRQTSRQLNRKPEDDNITSRPVRYYAFAILSQEDLPQATKLDIKLNTNIDTKPDTKSERNSEVKSERNSDTKSSQLTQLEQMGFEVVEHQLVTAHSLKEEITTFRQKITNLGIPSDGLVLTYDDIPYSLSLGTTSKFPKDTLAFKWADELAETTLLHIDWNTSRTGLINPIAVFDPVEIEGTTVNKAGLHNVSILRQLALGPGDRIKVYKANMIIPQVAENLTKSNTATIPEHCPVCNTKTEIRSLREGEALYCLNPNCQAQVVRSLAHFCSRDAMNIEGLSVQTLEKWVERGFITDYTDIFELERYEEEITQMEGFGQKSFDNLKTAIEKAKDIKLPNFIYALGIKHVGLSNAKLLCTHYGNAEAIIEGSKDEQALESIKGFGGAIANSIHVYFADQANLNRIYKIMKILRIKSIEKKAEKAEEAEEAEADLPLKGLTFVVTGSIEHFKNRKELQTFIEERGGKCVGTVSAKTSFLINNDAKSSSAKNKKAQSLDIPILTEEMFLERWG